MNADTKKIAGTAVIAILAVILFRWLLNKAPVPASVKDNLLV